ncbi:MAG: arylsulfatase [Bacteroidales bacterium]
MKTQLLSGVTLISLNFISSPLIGQNNYSVEKPNIIYILMDDMGYGEAGCYGQEKIETPNIDKLREKGMLFTQHYSGSPVSGPSRCVLQTGLHSGHSYIRGNDEVTARGDVWSHDAMYKDAGLEGQMPLKPGTMTLGRLLQSAGYTTACIGKWGLGYPGSVGTPNKQGFDFFYGYNCQRQAHTYFPGFLYRNEEREYLANEVVPPSTKLDPGADPRDPASYEKYYQKEYANDLMYKEILAFVDQNKDKPFFMMWTTPLPHVSLQAPKRWVDYYLKKFGDEEPYLGNKGYYPCRYPHATYAGMISYFDEQVGGLIAKLKEEGLYENTLIVFTSDNGPTFNGGSDSPWFNSGGIFKSEAGWGKCSLHEGGIRVPTIMAWPGKIKKNSKSDHISAFYDMMPTFAELAGVECPPTDGISLMPTLLGKKQEKHDYLYWEYPEGGGSRALRQGDWKLLISNIRKNPKIELFNLSKDVREQNDLSAENQTKVNQLLDLMEGALVESEHPAFRMKFVR